MIGGHSISELGITTLKKAYPSAIIETDEYEDDEV